MGPHRNMVNARGKGSQHSDSVTIHNRLHTAAGAGFQESSILQQRSLYKYTRTHGRKLDDLSALPPYQAISKSPSWLFIYLGSTVRVSSFLNNVNFLFFFLLLGLHLR
uniref:Uncharacterized protein n=1 Tax=Rhipicephalus zambeziensis TaxID=60191 RepID=A0A224YFW0_9ACAR